MKSETIIRGTGNIVINGHTVYLRGKSMKITEDGIYVDGVCIDQHTVHEDPSKVIKIEITGDVQSIQTGAADITVHGNVDMAKTMSGDIRCNVVENMAKTMSGSIICDSISGNCSTMSGDIIHR